MEVLVSLVAKTYKSGEKVEKIHIIFDLLHADGESARWYICGTL